MSKKKSFVSRFMSGMKKKNNGMMPPDIPCKTTIQDSIPIYAVHEQVGLIETYPGFFTRSYYIGETNYQSETEDVQQNLFIRLRSVFNALGSNVEMGITIFNKNLDMEIFKETVLLKERGDDLDYLRREENRINVDRIQEGKNGIEKRKYVTLGLHCEDVSKAHEVFSKRLDRELDANFKKLQSFAKPIPIEERIEILHDIYNMAEQGGFLSSTKVAGADGEMVSVNSFDFDNLRKMGISVQDIIGPSSIQYKDKYIQMGSKYVRAMIIDNLPAALCDDFFVKLTDVDFNMMATVNIQPIPSKAAAALVHRNLVLARNEKAEQRKSLIKANLPEEMVSPEVEDKVMHAEELRNSMVAEDEKLFKTTYTVVFWADSLEELQSHTDTIVANAQSAVVGIRILDKLQEQGFNSTLPLLDNEIKPSMRRTLKSSSLTALAMPFSIVELSDLGGIIYSVNLISKNLIIFDRKKSLNQNGFIFGSSGSGKSFAAKMEMLNVMLGSDSDCIVIDPEGEYTSIARLLGGECVKLEPGGKWHVNPMEVSSDYEWTNLDDSIETNPILAKSDFIMKLLNVIIKTPYNSGLSSIQETIIDECVHALFAPFMTDGHLGHIPPEKMPTLTDLQKILSKRQEVEAREIALGLKLYTGDSSLNVFGFRSNVDMNSRFVVFSLRDIGDKLKPIAMLIIMDHILQKMFENQRQGKHTWMWVDECHLLLNDPMTTEFLTMLWKRARKFGGVPTGMTQNVSDLIDNEVAKNIVKNSSFVILLNQMSDDRDKLADILNLSQSQVDVITNAGKGQGLLYTGDNVVPFASTFPKDNSIYKCLTSTLSEVLQYEEEDKRRAMQEKKAERKRETIGA